jgi:hypothetical protein
MPRRGERLKVLTIKFIPRAKRGLKTATIKASPPAEVLFTKLLTESVRRITTIACLTKNSQSPPENRQTGVALGAIKKTVSRLTTQVHTASASDTLKRCKPSCQSKGYRDTRKTSTEQVCNTPKCTVQIRLVGTEVTMLRDILTSENCESENRSEWFRLLLHREWNKRKGLSVPNPKSYQTAFRVGGRPKEKKKRPRL